MKKVQQAQSTIDAILQQGDLVFATAKRSSKPASNPRESDIYLTEYNPCASFFIEHSKWTH